MCARRRYHMTCSRKFHHTNAGCINVILAGMLPHKLNGPLQISGVKILKVGIKVLGITINVSLSVDEFRI